MPKGIYDNSKRHSLKGFRHSSESKIKMSLSKKGKTPRLGVKVSEESRKKMSLSHKGFKHFKETLLKMSEIKKGKPPYKMNDNTRKNMSIAQLGKKHPHTLETRFKIGLKHKGENCHFWKGGVCSKNELDRKNFEYKKWREAIFKRDNWTCQRCFKVGGKLQAHHKKSWANFIKLRYNINNGETLCEDCHKKTENFGFKNNKKLKL